MTVSFLTYNVLFNSALTNFHTIISMSAPDVICLQEIETSEKNLKRVEQHGYRLADFSNSFIKFGKVYGLATFYNPKTLHFVHSQSLTLPRSYYEFLLVLLRGGNNPRTVLKTVFETKKTKKKITNYNLHLTPIGGGIGNGIRVKQMKTTLSDLNLDSSESIIIAGDFNYSYKRKQFEELIQMYGLQEATNNVFSTFEGKFLKLFPMSLKLDYILYKNISLIRTEKVLTRDSDHYPIVSTFET